MNSVFAACVAILAVVFLAAWPVNDPIYAPAATEAACRAASWKQAGRPPFYVVPLIDGFDLADPARVSLMTRKLDMLEPGGAAGKVRLGYTLQELPLAFYVPGGKGSWRLDLSKFDADLKEAARIGRPFVFYALADHYTAWNLPFVAEMRRDPRNMMRYRDGTIPDETFFGFRLTSFTLSTDETIPVVRATNDALRAIAARLHAFDRAHPGLLAGIELNGETHYMFHDFFTGTGDFTRIELTDYSDEAVAEFKSRQKRHGRSAGDIRKIDFADGASGYLPISGWLSGPEKNTVIDIVIDGQKRGEATSPNSRMDVYELPGKQIDDPNVGFGKWIDAAELKPGRHLLQVVASPPGGTRFEIGRRSIDVGPVAGSPPTPSGLELPHLRKPWQGSLDQPRNEYPLNYEPLARDWLRFREKRVALKVEGQAAIFRRAGFDERRIFSYQFAPWMVGGWNEMLFGIPRDFFRLPGMLPGINTYNGSFMNPRAFDYVDTRRGYAIPESHPQMPGAERRIAETLRWHYCHGAIYLGPYFLKAKPDVNLSPHDKFRISEDNPVWGSDDYYRALRDFVRQ